MSDTDRHTPTPPPLPPAAMQAPSPDVAPVAEDSRLPGEHRGGFARLPTAPVGIPVPVTEPEELLVPSAQWVFPDPPAPQRGIAAWALVAAVLGLVVSMFVGWGFPIGLVGIVTAIIALRRPFESRQMAIWAIVLSAVSVIYSAGWLLWAASRVDLLG